MHGIVWHLQITGFPKAASSIIRRLVFILSIAFCCLTGIFGSLETAQAQAQAQDASNSHNTTCSDETARPLRIALPEIVDLGQGAGVASLFDIEKTRLEAILAEAGYCIRFYLLPWLRADNQIKNGALDGFVSTQNIGWYKRDYFISAPFAEIDVYVLTNPEKFAPEGYTYEDLAELRVAILLGDSLGFELSGRGIPYTTLPATANLTRFLQAGRVDAVLGYKALFEKSAADALDKQLLRMSYIGKRELYLMIHREVGQAKSIIDGLNALLP
ncbi:hypothetical protein ACQ0MK_04765 [Thalassospira lucentensis]|uniref:hypothetical protein n=1 Tax=Thalassospira lucentensis TaxID=168935 RepID=UPI003D2F207E